MDGGEIEIEMEMERRRRGRRGRRGQDGQMDSPPQAPQIPTGTGFLSRLDPGQIPHFTSLSLSPLLCSLACFYVPLFLCFVESLNHLII
jgi:hypothetical protein